MSIDSINGWFSWNALQALSTLAAAIFSVVIAHMLRRRERQRYALDAFDNYRRELLAFSNEVIVTMSEGEALIKCDPSQSPTRAVVQQRFVDQRLELMSRLSALVDRGRFFFPNHEIGQVGQHKGEGNRGARDPVLNRILAAHFVLKAVNYHDFKRNFRKLDVVAWKCSACPTASEDDVAASRAFKMLSKPERERLCNIAAKGADVSLLHLLIAAKRSYVSEIFAVVQPRDWLENVEKNYGIQLRSREPEQFGSRLNGE